MSDTSKILKTITGVVLVQKNDENRLYCIADLEKSNELSIGQIFTAVRVLYGKEISDYPEWPSYKLKDGTVSNQFLYISGQFKNKCKNDLERFKAACLHLKEEIPEVIDKEKTQERLDIFKSILPSNVSVK